MKATIVSIGDSKGIKIPNTVLEQCHIKSEVTLEVVNCNIIIQPANKTPRKNWEQCFQEMSKNKEDRLIIDDNLDLDTSGWEW
ncbi:MAG: AbrB/MazE/SpoVT family DNA-binding domain-containing protein [Candidatus Schekmanbacteria bacterium]|nr:AbrB/MazE/SpoVT family DNA-binding domain-containing protein [Candidatus Schekmanbacteria bacterium]